MKRLTVCILLAMAAMAPAADVKISELPSATSAAPNDVIPFVQSGTTKRITVGNLPISTATQAALDLKAPLASPTFTGTVSGITKAMVGLPLVENTALSTWTGSTSLTTLGTIAAGTWNGSVIAPAYLGSGSSITTKFLRGDGTWQAIGGGGDALVANPLSQFASTTSAQLRGVLSDESGTGVILTANGDGSGLTGLTQSQVSGLTTTSVPQFSNVRVTQSTLTYGATPALDFSGDGFRTITLAGDATFSSSNLAAGRSVTVRIVGDGSTRTLSFPAWKFVGAAAPTTLAAGKTAVLTVTSFGTTDANCVAAYAVEP